MAQQWKVPLSPGNPIEDMARLAAKYQELVSGYDETLRGLQESVRQVTDERNRANRDLDDVRAVFESLTEATARAEQLSAAAAPGTRSRLQSVPPQDTRRPDSGPPPAPTEAPAAGGQGPAVLTPKVRELLNVMRARPDTEWTSMDLAALQGLHEEDRLGRKRLRNTLRDGVAKGFLVRITYDGDRRVYYRVVANAGPA